MSRFYFHYTQQEIGNQMPQLIGDLIPKPAVFSAPGIRLGDSQVNRRRKGRASLSRKCCKDGCQGLAGGNRKRRGIWQCRNNSWEAVDLFPDLPLKDRWIVVQGSTVHFCVKSRLLSMQGRSGSDPASPLQVVSMVTKIRQQMQREGQQQNNQVLPF